MAKNRLYELEYPSRDDRPIYLADIGHILQISGVMFSGNGKNVLLMIPGDDIQDVGEFSKAEPTLDEWSAIVRASDNPEYYDELKKVWLRKASRVISGHVQQRIFWRDGFKCVYCNRIMGKEVQLTVDHWIPLDLGGANNNKNYFAACRRCNKKKGNMHPQRWCAIEGLDYQALCEFLEKHG